jgi:hypothetical protein
MQNRSMFPYRRHGSKKRSKGPARKSRGPQRPLPNSARDLLPLLQPATKALAQMLAGRTGASGQLNHARNLLAHAERLISDRVHNRLIPAEREEFFEQLARLRLTLADADAEAEVQAAEEQVEKRPPPPPVAQERLKEMALALTRPERDRLGPLRPAEEPAGGRVDDRSVRTEASSEVPAEEGAPAEEQRPALRPLADLPGRLVLSKAGSETARRAIGRPVASRRPRSPAPAPPRPSHADEPAEDVDPAAGVESTSPDPGSNGAAATAATQPRGKVARRTRKTKDGLPQGWVIDEEGYVVPRHG